MGQNDPVGDTGRADPVMQRWGCAVFLIAGLLFAIERYLLFSFLLSYSSTGGGSASQALGFLYGKPPYSIFDVLLGFQMPDEGLFFLLQPHNILLGLSQAVHYGINLAVAYAPLWVLEKWRRKTETRPIMRIGGCIGILLIPVALIGGAIMCVNSAPGGTGARVTPVASAAPRLNRYANPATGVTFSFPVFMTLQEDVKKDRGPGGELITLTTIAATSQNPVVGFLVRIVEDPLRNQMYPSLYPVMPEDPLRTLVVGEISSLNYPKSDANGNAAIAASNNAVITSIAGYQAATYEAGLEGTPLGHVRLRGALVITEKRDVSLYLIGSDEPNAPGSVDSAYVDSLWSQLLADFDLDF